MPPVIIVQCTAGLLTTVAIYEGASDDISSCVKGATEAIKLSKGATETIKLSEGATEAIKL